MLHNIKNRGFTIIELVIAIFILAVAIIGVYNSFSTVVILTRGVSSRLTASYLVQEGMEIVRNIRDNNWKQGGAWDEGGWWDKGLLDCEDGCEADYKTGTLMDIRSGLISFGSSGNYLNINNDNGFYSYDSVGSFTATKFKRKIIITPQRNDVLKVFISVTWKEKEEEGCDFGHCIEAEAYLYNWY